MDPIPPAGAPLEDARSYRAIFDASENAILVLDWDSAALLDANIKACEFYGATREELLALNADELGWGEEPYGRDAARQYLQLARKDRCPTFKWRRRHKDGSLRWSEVRLKPAVLGGQRTLI